MRRFIHLAVISIIALSALTVGDAAATAEHVAKAVLITGASSGIGRNATERLAKAGYFVYAGARSDKDIEALNAIDNVEAIRLDVTKQDQIDAAVAKVAASKRQLWGVVNNAGVNVIDPLIEANEADLTFVFDVNVYGVFRITKAFAPLVIKSKGRIVNISSISGVLSGGLPGYGVYTMSKHAVEAFNDQLAFEMAPLGVAVSAIEPGAYHSEIGNSRCRRMLARENAGEYKYFAAQMARYFDDCRELLAGKLGPSGPEPDAVAEAIEHALFSTKPKQHYLVVPEEFQANITIRKGIEEILHLNQGQPYTYTRDELIQILDEEIATMNGEVIEPDGVEPPR